MESRITELEVKVGFTEDLLEELNRSVYRQQQQIDFLLRELAALRQQVSAIPSESQNMRDEIPPHY